MPQPNFFNLEAQAQIPQPKLFELKAQTQISQPKIENTAQLQMQLQVQRNCKWIA